MIIKTLKKHLDECRRVSPCTSEKMAIDRTHIED